MLTIININENPSARHEKWFKDERRLGRSTAAIANAATRVEKP
jgi:hypothetical protein